MVVVQDAGHQLAKAGALALELYCVLVRAHPSQATYSSLQANERLLGAVEAALQSADLSREDPLPRPASGATTQEWRSYFAVLAGREMLALLPKRHDLHDEEAVAQWECALALVVAAFCRFVGHEVTIR